jgi:hypothetical protein
MFHNFSDELADVVSALLHRNTVLLIGLATIALIALAR